MTGLRVAVVGCGTAGPAVAALLARGGHLVDLFERTAAPGPVGAGLLLQPSGLAALDRIGVGAAVRAAGAPVARIRGHARRGSTVLDVAYPEGVHGVGIHRGALFTALLGAALGAGARLRPGIEITAAEIAATTTLIDTEHRRHGPFDLVVAADGGRSRLRGSLGLRHRVQEYPYGALWCVRSDPDGVSAGALNQVYDGTRRMAGILPIGRAADAGQAQAAVFWSLPVAAYPAWQAAGLDAWLAEVAALFPAAATLLAGVRREDIAFARYLDVRMPRPWVGNVVCLGDAAHAMSPQLGQGANLALIDAVELAGHLLGITRGDEVPGRLAAHAAARREHVRFYTTASRWLTPFFQSDLTWLGPLRDLAAPVYRLPPLATRARQALLGQADGWWTVRSG